MKFCKSCKTIFHDKDEYCPNCRKALCEITDINEPVRLCVTGGTERAMLCGLLDDAGIPHLESNFRQQGVANEIVTGYDVKLNNISVTVPFQALPEAIELLGTIETASNPLESMTDEIKAHIEFLRSQPGQKKEMSRAKKTTVKVITALLFLALIAAVVLGTDAVTGWIKGLFGG